MDWQRAFTGVHWEAKVGYCRAIRAGGHIYVTGTVAVPEGGGAPSPDLYLQAKRCLQIIEKALGELGADLSHVVRTRMFVTDISRWEQFGKAHREAFAAHPPATSMLEVKALIDPAMLIEIEADAVVG